MSTGNEQKYVSKATRADLLTRQNIIHYSICTLVTRFNDYEAMIASFVEKGFSYEDCEYIYLDNSTKNEYDAFSGNNLFFTAASGDYIILCHQDVRLEFDDRRVLDAVLSDLDSRRPDWGLCGNAGASASGKLVFRISDPHGENQKSDGLPQQVISLDEDFIVAKRSANLAQSHDISGFHLYGADLCMIANVLGRSAHVVDFHLRHLSGGRLDESFHRTQRALVARYQKKFRSRWVITTCTAFFISGLTTLSIVMNSSLMRHIVTRLARKGALNLLP